MHMVKKCIYIYFFYNLLSLFLALGALGENNTLWKEYITVVKIFASSFL